MLRLTKAADSNQQLRSTPSSKISHVFLMYYTSTQTDPWSDATCSRAQVRQRLVTTEETRFSTINRVWGDKQRVLMAKWRLMIAAKKAVEYTSAHPEVNRIYIFADCTSAIAAIHEPKPRAAQRYAAVFREKILDLLDHHPNIKVELSWCPSHCGIKGNERSDELAKEATSFARDSPIGVTRTNALRRNKAALVKLWKREWHKTRDSGQFAVANRFPPSHRPSFRLTNLHKNRELYGRVIQCRTGHAYTGEFRQRFKLDGPYDCPCGEQLETREHILRDCTRYTAYRHVLQETSPNILLSDILGTKEGIYALAKFLKSSSAFSRSGQVPEPPPPPIGEPELPPDPRPEAGELVANPTLRPAHHEL